MRQRAGLAGVFYLLTILAGMTGDLTRSRVVGETASLLATGCYVVVTLLLYVLLKPVNTGISLMAAVFSLAGCVVGALEALHRNRTHVSSLVFFGVYCLLLGLLIYRSGFMPRILGVLVAISGVGWLTFISKTLGRQLSAYSTITGLLGEGALTLWLLYMGMRSDTRGGRLRTTGDDRAA